MAPRRNRIQPPLVCVAPTSWRLFLEEALPAAGMPVVIADRPRARRGPDPYQLSALAKEVGDTASGILLITPPNRSPASSVPGPVVGGLPVGLLCAASPRDLSPWLEACASLAASNKRRQSWAVLAEWETRYLRLAGRFAQQIDSLPGRQVYRWEANRLNRADLLEHLHEGPSAVCYFGHGQPEGLVGYHGLWREHLHECAGSPPVGAWLSFSCSTLAMPVRGLPFGMEVVSRGLTACYLGSVHPVLTRDNSRLAALSGEVISRCRSSTVAAVLRDIDQAVSRDGSDSLRQCWSTYRLAGSPIQPL